jgi:hypothetical protein
MPSTHARIHSVTITNKTKKFLITAVCRLQTNLRTAFVQTHAERFLCAGGSINVSRHTFCLAHSLRCSFCDCPPLKQRLHHGEVFLRFQCITRVKRTKCFKANSLRAFGQFNRLVILPFEGVCCANVADGLSYCSMHFPQFVKRVNVAFYMRYTPRICS